MRSQDLRSPLKRAAGLGSAHDGVGRWWLERLTAVALVPITLWFVASIIALGGRGHAAVVAWLREPWATLLMVLLLATLFAHLSLGLQVVIEDYVHSKAKTAALLAVRFGCAALAAAGILATLRITSGQ